jgi:hypothetical protein
VGQVDDRDRVEYTRVDNSWLLIRPSGTEPVLRIYAEAASESQVEELLEARGWAGRDKEDSQRWPQREADGRTWREASRQCSCSFNCLARRRRSAVPQSWRRSPQ